MHNPDSPCAKRHRGDDGPQVVNNNNTTNNNNIHNYFAPASGPAAIPEDTRPPNLFPEKERKRDAYVPYHGKTRSYRVSHATRDGQLKAGCTNCLSNYKDMVQFAPPECNHNGRRRPQFLEALEAYSVAWEARDLEAARAARAEAEELRNALCPSCQEKAGHLSPAQQACKDEYVRMRKAACKKNDGCANPDCVERGDQTWCVLQGDHLHTAKEEDEALRKKERLGDYKWWSGNGDVAAMRAEEAKGMQWLCGFCHFLEPTGTPANRCPDPWAKHKDGTPVMPDGKRRGTKDETKQYDAKRHAKIKYPKQQYVDARKRAVGRCQRCDRADVEGKEWAFHWDHRDPATKLKGKDTLAGEWGGVAGLVANCAKAAALDAPGFKEVLDAEMDKCDLLCHNCHHRKTWGYPMRE